MKEPRLDDHDDEAPEFTISMKDVERLALLLSHVRKQLNQRIDWLRRARRDHATAEELEEAMEELEIMVGVFLTRDEVQPYRKRRDVETI